LAELGKTHQYFLCIIDLIVNLIVGFDVEGSKAGL
jgi:hypothetical protein